MASSKKNDVISVASHHTIKKFELISKYVEAWAEILLNSGKCDGLVYIDCMSNSGVYRKEKDSGEIIEGTALRVANILSETVKKYPGKKVYIYFNDLDSRKIDELVTRLPKMTNSFQVYTDSRDASELLKGISQGFDSTFKGMHFLLLYDPYDADIDWEALSPFMKKWGEVIINHMVSDTLRAVKVAKKQSVIDKYERTYMSTIEELIAFGSDRTVYEQKVQNIIKNLCGREDRYYVAMFPFFNQNNAAVYDLIHCTGHHLGFDLFKETAWKTFGDKSADKKGDYNSEYEQLTLNFETGEVGYEKHTDESCYTMRDVASYAQSKFRGMSEVMKNDVLEYISDHPVFPTRNYKQKIWHALNRYYGAEIHQKTITFKDRSA